MGAKDYSEYVNRFVKNLKDADGGKYFTADRFDEWFDCAVGTRKTSQMPLRAIKHVKSYDLPAALDLESSTFQRAVWDTKTKVKIQPFAIMYIWQFGLNGAVIVGRTWNEYEETMRKLREVLKLGPDRRLIVYVHNLGYEFQWIRYRFNWTDIFAMTERQPIYASCVEGYQFRCSQILTNSSLDQVGKNLTKYKVSKMVGDLDYRLIRTPLTTMTKEEMCYCINDVLVVMALIREKMDEEGCIRRIPLTKTGYARRKCRAACLYEDKRTRYKHMDLMKKLILTPEEFLMAKKAFAGGFTHGNVWYVANGFYRDVGSFDFTSSYPAVMLSEKFPMSRGKEIDVTSIRSRKDLDKYFARFCCLVSVTFEGLTGRDGTPDHYLSASKTHNSKDERREWVIDNGRIVEADSVTITVTDIDIQCIDACYSYTSITVHKMFVYQRAYLPIPILKTILELYRDKTSLKGVAGREDDYQRAKELLNSLYGMMVTDIARQSVVYDSDTWGHTPADVNECVEDYNVDDGRFLSYLWGVWITAYARRNLWAGILEFGRDYIYSDTDSIKCLNYQDHMAWIDEYNKQITAKLERMCICCGFDKKSTAPKTIDGVEKPIGVWDFEGVYDRFKTLGAKRYMTMTKDVLNVTISGVNKMTAVPYLLRTHGLEFEKDKKKPIYHITTPDYENQIDAIFDEFTDGFEIPGEYEFEEEILTGAGKLIHTYIDYSFDGTIVDYTGVSFDYAEKSAVALVPSAYSLGLAGEFVDLLNGVHPIC